MYQKVAKVSVNSGTSLCFRYSHSPASLFVTLFNNARVLCEF